MFPLAHTRHDQETRLRFVRNHLLEGGVLGINYDNSAILESWSSVEEEALEEGVDIDEIHLAVVLIWVLLDLVQGDISDGISEVIGEVEEMYMGKVIYHEAA